MMRSRISENESLKKAFRDIYAAKEREETGDGWQFQVMKRVRRIGPLTPASNFLPAFEHFVWRLAPVSCLLVIALTLLLMNIDFGGGNDYLGTVTVDLEQPTLVEIFGLEG
jgi:hypothetical protein